MRCINHPAVETQEACSACSRALCNECIHRIKGKPYCEDCLARGAEWASTVKDLRLPSDSPKRAALCAIIPGMGAVYNNEYLKAITYFAVWAALITMGTRVSGVFGFGSFVFLVFTIFDAYRSAEDLARRRIETGIVEDRRPTQDKALIGWGVLLIVMGILFLLHNLIPYYWLYRFWPILFIALGAYLVYRAIKSRDDNSGESTSGENI
ncbi:MAG: hypothetical protein GXX84_12350 [Acidobacteria bacterium]|nr:hypothetical protein [Acidobacteriota bacterium]